MNKPKIYASCKAGCLWETVHYSDFLAAGGLVPLVENEETHKYYLTDLTKNVNEYIDCDLQFKIYDASKARFNTGNDYEGKWLMRFGIRVERNGQAITNRYFTTVPTRAEFAHVMDFHLHNMEIDYETGKLSIYFTLQGEDERYTDDITINEDGDIISVGIFVENIGYTMYTYAKGYENSAVYLLGAGGEGLNITVEDAVSDEQVAAAVENYIKENPISGVSDEQVIEIITQYLTDNPIESASELTDTSTGAKYSLSVIDGKLALTELTD
jgi:hypothetical protein